MPEVRCREVQPTYGRRALSLPEPHSSKTMPAGIEKISNGQGGQLRRCRCPARWLIRDTKIRSLKSWRLPRLQIRRALTTSPA